MDTLVQIKPSANDLHLSITEHMKELGRATNAASKSEEMLRYLDFCAKFHNYSPGNIWLIMLARPEASLVAGYSRWKSMGRWVQKGESGIPILAPVLVKDEDEDGVEKQVLIGFKVVYVFDVAQTEGEPLPEPPDWKSPEKNHELNERLIRFAQSQGISVTFKNLLGETQGISKGGSVDIDLSAGTKTLVHELAHELMHKGKDNFQSRAIKELEAESVAFVVCKHFGLSALNSPNYLAFFEVTETQILASMERIRNMANKIITAIEPSS